VYELAERHIGPVLTEEGHGWERVDRVPADTVWATRRELRSRLVDDIRRRLRQSWLQRGASEAELGWIETAFDPDVLTIGFARRVPSYKRLTLMLRDRERLTSLLLDAERPIQIVIAGKSHPADDSGKALVQQIVRFTDDPAIRHRIAFLPDYDMAMAAVLLAGCDVWLNNPLRPLEACGTSGMKAALNGCLNLSIRDGWWDEWYDGGNGWAIPSADGVSDPDRRDELEAAALYEIIEKDVRAKFYDRDRDGLPQRWLEMVRHDLRSLGPKVLASRMVREYVERLYTGAAAAARAMSESSYAGARELAAWRSQLVEAWPGVRVMHVDATGGGDTPQIGTSIGVRAVVDLGGLAPDDVTVQVAYGRVDELDRIDDVTVHELADVGVGDDGLRRYEGNVPLDRSGPFGYTVRVLPRHRLLASSAELGLVVNAQ
jgi:starch phosphorylase